MATERLEATVTVDEWLSVRKRMRGCAWTCQYDRPWRGMVTVTFGTRYSYNKCARLLTREQPT